MFTPGANTEQTLQQLTLALNSPQTPEQQQQILQTLKSNQHRQEIEKFKLGVDDNTSPNERTQSNHQEARKVSMQRCIHMLVHASQCHDANCLLTNCPKMKRVVQHSNVCKSQKNGACSICKQLIACCCHHAKHCQESNCPVPFCSNIKHTLKDPQLQQRVQCAQLLRGTSTVAPTDVMLCNNVPLATGVQSDISGPASSTGSLGMPDAQLAQAQSPLAPEQMFPAEDNCKQALQELLTILKLPQTPEQQYKL